MPTLKPASSANRCRQVSRQGRVGEEIRHVRRNRVERGSQDLRQAHQGGLHVVLGQRLSANNDAIEARGGRQKAAPARLALQDHAAAALFHQWGVTDELDRVAEALLACNNRQRSGKGSPSQSGAGRGGMR